MPQAASPDTAPAPDNSSATARASPIPRRNTDSYSYVLRGYCHSAPLPQPRCPAKKMWRYSVVLRCQYGGLLCGGYIYIYKNPLRDGPPAQAFSAKAWTARACSGAPVQCASVQCAHLTRRVALTWCSPRTLSSSPARAPSPSRDARSRNSAAPGTHGKISSDSGPKEKSVTRYLTAPCRVP